MNTVTIRFYEELNDFLPEEKRKKQFEHNFWGKPSIKDLIESLGVPHTEVDLILVNGESVNFNYLVRDKDRISVYPEFESFDISNLQKLRPKPLRKPKFICDVHLGKLARGLRMFGFDVYYQNNLSDEQIIEISLTQKRTILTKDLGILKRKEVTRGYFVREENAEKQIAEIIEKFDLITSSKPLTLCLECGGKLLRISRKKISNFESLPQKVKESQNQFFICKDCKNLYWRGTHYENMKLSINNIIKFLNADR